MYRCPLCNQEVGKHVYEKITGLWKERERVEIELKEKQEKLIEREKKLRESFAEQKKNIVAQERKKLQVRLTEQKQELLASVREEKKALKAERQKLATEYNRKLAAETKKIVSYQKAHFKEQHDKLRLQFELSTQSRVEKEKAKLASEIARVEKNERLQSNRYSQLHKQFAALQSSSVKELERRNQRIQSLEEQIKKNQTPQVLGLLEEGVFLTRLQETFTNDRFDHTGKGGDIVHHIIENRKEIGLIVYELKKVSKFSPAHIEQAYLAKQQRKADYGILVTNAKRNSRDTGFSISKGIIIIHPAGALVLVSILRDHIKAISHLKLSREKREATIDAVLDYIQSPVFKNGIDSVINDTVDLYNHLKREVKEHISEWEIRLNKYRNIYSQVEIIEQKVVNLVAIESNPPALPRPTDIQPIELPSEIE
jgi:hypothetical protein